MSAPFSPGYRAASENVDWGQDFYRLQEWSIGRHPAVAYLGPRHSRVPHGSSRACPIDRLISATD